MMPRAITKSKKCVKEITLPRGGRSSVNYWLALGACVRVRCTALQGRHHATARGPRRAGTAPRGMRDAVADGAWNRRQRRGQPQDVEHAEPHLHRAASQGEARLH